VANPELFDKIAMRPNQRPRKTLGFEIPASRLRASVAPIYHGENGVRTLKELARS
jgi:hypothetical protein